jgi:HEAT repeat protein
VPVLVATRQDTSAGVRVAARQALLTLPSAMVPLSRHDLLSEILADGDASESSRADAARMLGEAQDVRGIPLLITALDAAPPAGRPAATVGDFMQARAAAKSSLAVAAARALGQLRATAAVPSLVRAARKSEGEVRVAALEALTRIRAPEGIPVAIDCLGDREPRSRRWAALLLGELEARDALGPLRSALQDSDEGVRLYATRALVKMGDASAVDNLVDALAKEPVPQVRDALQHALAVLAPVGLW